MTHRMVLHTLLPAFLGAVLATAPASAAQRAVRVEFTETPVPASTQDRVTPHSKSSALVTFADGTRQTFPLIYQPLYYSGDYVNGWYAGLIVDQRGTPLTAVPTSSGEVARGPFFAYAPDGNSLIQPTRASIPGVSGHPLMLVTNYEYHTRAPNQDASEPPVDMYLQLPMVINLTLIDQAPDSGELRPVTVSNIDVSSIAGIWAPCAASLTPWNTHLGGEEYEPDAQTYETLPLEAMNAYRGTLGKTAAQGGANPYHYGHAVEVDAQSPDKTRVTKHYAMGRLSLELAEVMPDRRTAYLGDDDDDVVRLMFVADRAADLSAGTLYAAKWIQEAATDFGRAKLYWIRLGHGTDREVKALIERDIRFSDIFEVASPAQRQADPDRYREHRPVLVSPGSGGGKARLEYLRLKPGQELAAAFLETRRYAAYLGATSELTKMEGQAHNAADRKLYTAISNARAGMLEGRNGDRPQDDIHLSGDATALACGAVYQSNLARGVRDSQGNPIDSDWVASDMRPLVYGASKPPDQTQGEYDTCDTQRIANPDNIKFSAALRTLFISEDSTKHLNNFLWAYEVSSHTLVRIFSAPVGAEISGLQTVDDYHGHGYIMVNVQHPGAAKDLKSYPDEIRLALRRRVDPRGIIGYLSGLPGLARAD